MNLEKQLEGLAPEHSAPLAPVDAAITAAQACLSRLFHSSSEEENPNRPRDGWRSDRAGKTEIGGFWCGELEADTTLESDYILFLHLLDASLYSEKIQKLARFIIRHQLEDGSWNIYFGGPGEISASVKAYVALRLSGFSPEDPVLRRARDAILRMGGAEKVNSYTKVYLSFLGLYPWQEVPALPPEVVLLPRFFFFNIYEISYWSRAILIPLSILYAKWPGAHGPQHLPDGLDSIDELFVGRPPRARAHRGPREEPAAASPTDLPNRVLDGDAPVDSNLFSWRSFFVLMNRLLQIAEKTPVKPLRNIALRKAEEWMVQRLQDSDGLGAIFPSMVNSVLALLCLGYSKDHELIRDGLEKLRELEIEEGDEMRLQPCLSPVWDTALAVNALGESGFPADAKQMVESGQWLVSKEVRRPGDWQMRVPHAEVSGWAFQFRNDFYPDIDDTAAVIMALGRIDPARVEGLTASLERGINWILSLQCSTGGWAAFDADVEREVLNAVPYADHNAMLDPACADITGRVLESLGRFPSMRSNPRVRRAIRNGVEFLKSEQNSDGSWYGRWGVNYIYGTWQSLKGLREVGEDPRQDYFRRAVDFLESRQNADGGWGESCLSYDNPSTAGEGPSTASQTAWAVMGLLAAGETHSAAVRRGIEYLLSHQGADGNWEEDHWTGTGFPSVFYLKYTMYRLYFPLFALGMYRNAIIGEDPVRERVHIDLERARQPLAAAEKPHSASLARKGVLRSLFGLLG